MASLVLHMALLADSVAPWVFCLELSVLQCNNNASRYKVMYALNVHSCCHLVIDVHILVSPNDGCPCMWSGVVCQGNLDSALREVPYTSLRRTAGRQGLSPPRLITRAHFAASLAFPWLKTCYNCWWVLCMYIFNDITHGKIIYPGAMSHICTYAHQSDRVPQGKPGKWMTVLFFSGLLGCTSTVIHHTYCILLNMKRDKRKYKREWMLLRVGSMVKYIGI